MKTKSILVALSVMVIVLLGNSSTAAAQSAETDTKSKETVATEIVVTVKSGDTLEAIANEHQTTYVRLFNANPAITHPDLPRS